MQKQKREKKENRGGKPKTSGLFIQNGGKTYDLLDFYSKYMETRDPTGYKFAQIALTAVPEYERWHHYQQLLANPWFARYIERWNEELEIKMRAEAIQSIKNGCDPKDFPRLRWLAEGKAFSAPKAGRPKKEKAERQSRVQSSLRRLNPNAYEAVLE